MSLKSRKRAAEHGKKEKTPTYCMTQEQIDSLVVKEVGKIREHLLTDVVDKIVGLTYVYHLMTLFDNFGFTPEQCWQFYETAQRKADTVATGDAVTEEWVSTLREEVGIDFTDLMKEYMAEENKRKFFLSSKASSSVKFSAKKE